MLSLLVANVVVFADLAENASSPEKSSRTCCVVIDDDAVVRVPDLETVTSADW